MDIVRSRRKTIAIQIREGKLIMKAPLRMADRDIQAFIDRHEKWIRVHMEKAQTVQAAAAQAGVLSEEQIRELAKAAAEVIPERAAHFASLMGVSYGRITIRLQKTRWGSCSSRGNLNFNCLLMLCPPQVLDSVVVHELAHRKEMNHSDRFYAIVRRVYPEYDRWNRWLKENGPVLQKRAAGDVRGDR